MSLKPRSRLGNYEITALIGAGGMGEVYKARDPKLDRMVAIKVLPQALADNSDLLARFDREAKAVAALSHPNVLGIFDLGSQDGITYAVMELLEGENLRDKLKDGALPPRRAIEIAVELAQGLGAAHERGIVHRDVKPENIFITREGRVKVLDFGLAKQVNAAKGEQATEAMSQTPNGTEAGMLLGTVGYMSPEQIKGEPADHRADIFAFGVVLFEMLSGQRPFHGETAHHTMTAILDQDPPPLTASKGPMPPALERLLAHCLEKHPKARFQSMADIAFALQNLSTASEGPCKAQLRSRPRRAMLSGALAASAFLGLLAALLWACHLPPFNPPPPPSFQRITFAPGTVESARFGPDGKTILYSARIAGAKPDVFVLHPGEEEPKAMGLGDANLLGVSPANVVSVLRRPEIHLGGMMVGLLAELPAGGGALKDIQEQVVDAASDAQGLAALVTLEPNSRLRLEFPLGRTLLEASASQVNCYHLCLSRDGQHLALVFHLNQSDAKILDFDRDGQRRVLYTRVGDNIGSSLTGLAWSPDGALLFTELQGDQTVLFRLSGTGRPQMLWRTQGVLQLMDVSPDGRMLVAAHQLRMGALVQRAGESQARDLSVQSGTQVTGISADGRSVLLLESLIRDGGSDQDQAYLRPTDGGPALKLARGNPRSLSPDGRWVHLYLPGQNLAHLDPAVAGAIRQAGLEPAAALNSQEPRPCLVFLPTGTGRPWALALPASFEDADFAFLLPGGQRLVFAGTERGKDLWFFVDRKDGKPVPIAPEGYGLNYAGLVPLSPDGTRFIVTGDRTNWYTVQIPPVPGQKPQPIKGILPGERLLAWAADGRSVFVRPELSVLPITIHRVDIFTGARALVTSLAPPDRAGHLECRNVHLTPDARVFAFDFERQLSELYVMDGVK